MPQTVEGLDLRVADCIMSVAESTSMRAFGAACRQAIYQLTGSPAIGLYMLKPGPQLLYSRDVPDGFLAEYRNGMAKRDPLIDSVLEDGRVVDGASVYGAYGWPRSIAYDLLHSWGFCWNMCGPLRCESEIAGIFYTATPHARSPYTPALQQRMEVLCRAASVALTNMRRSGLLDRPDSGSNAPCLPVIRSVLGAQHALPPRSAEVAFRICRGETNKEIAREMGISDQTVKEHVANLFRRFGAHNRTELVGCLLSGLSRQ